MKKLLQQISNKKTGNPIMPILFFLCLMLASMIGIAQTAYVANFGDSSVSVINVATNTVIDSVEVGTGPLGVTVSPDGSKVYVTNQDSIGTVSVINTATNTVTATIPVGSYPIGICISPDGSKVYVANDMEDDISVINTFTNTVSTTISVGSYPGSVAVSPDGSNLYVVNYGDDDINVIKTATNLISATISVDNQPDGLSVSPDGSKVYVINRYGNLYSNGNGTVSVINPATSTLLATIIVGTNPSGIAVSPDGSNVYVANTYNDTVSVINTATNEVSASISLNTPNGIAVSPDGSKVYVTNSRNTVSVINTATNSVSSTITVGTFPAGCFISTYTAPLCGANFSIAADTTQLHHYLVTDNSYGKQPIKYVWSWGDGTMDDTIPYPSHTYADSGFYTICLSITDSAGCQSTYCDSSFHALRTTNTMVYVNVVNPLILGTKEVSLQTQEVVLYPNPATNQLTIHPVGWTSKGVNSSAFQNEVVTVSIFNLLGQEASPPAPLQRRGESAVIDVSGLQAGMYFLQMRSENGSVVTKFVKE